MKLLEINRMRWLEVDSRISSKMRVAERPGILRTLSKLLAHSGDSWFWLFGLLVLWLVGGEYWKTRSVTLAVGIVLTAVIVIATKSLVRRKRPAGDWGGIYRTTDPHSFPSGHAARAIMLAVLAIAIGPPWLAIVLILWAPFVSLARVAMGLHYFSDVLAGIVFGVVIGFVIVLAI
jgi:membrane-associated phospholipid phosphatase